MQSALVSEQPDPNPLLQTFQACAAAGIGAGVRIVISEPANSSIFRTTAK